MRVTTLRGSYWLDNFPKGPFHCHAHANLGRTKTPDTFPGGTPLLGPRQSSIQPRHGTRCPKEGPGGNSALGRPVGSRRVHLRRGCVTPLRGALVWSPPRPSPSGAAVRVRQGGPRGAGGAGRQAPRPRQLPPRPSPGPLQGSLGVGGGERGERGCWERGGQGTGSRGGSRGGGQSNSEPGISQPTTTHPVVFLPFFVFSLRPRVPPGRSIGSLSLQILPPSCGTPHS